MSSARAAGLLAAFFCLSIPLSAQEIVAARAGLVHFSDGRVLLNEKPIVHKIAQYQEVRELEYLRTERGRAEVLLTPGIFLRLGEDSQVQMLSTRLTDVRFRLLAGSAVIEADELTKDNSVTVTVNDTQVRLLHSGLYRLDAEAGETPRLRVFNGEALVVASAGAEYHVKNKKEIELAGDFVIKKFDPEDTDTLDRWSKRRANYLSAANISASRVAYNRGLSFSRSSWIWNPYFGMYTFLPYRNIAWSPYGCPFYSPVAVYRTYYAPRPSANTNTADFSAPSRSYNSAGGYTSVGQTSTGNSGVIASSPQSSVSQGGGGTVSRGGATSGGGGRR